MELDDFRINDEPYYRAVGDEVRLFTAAYAERMPIMLKGPTGCGRDSVRGAHGLQSRASAGDGGLP